MRSKIAPGVLPSVVVVCVIVFEQRLLRRTDELGLDEHAAGAVVRRAAEVAFGALETGADAGFGQRPQDRVGLCAVPRDGDGDKSVAHGPLPSSGFAPPRRSSGAPRSGSGSSMVSKSRGTTVFANTARASSLISRGVAREPRCVSASIFTSLADASSAASAAVV